jgi:hypothetical protein
MAKTSRILFVCFWVLISVGPAFSQSPDYKSIFGQDWNKAEIFVEENRAWIESKLKQYNVSYPEAIAVIFPELVRYSALRDKIEITLLKTLYINLGEEYANFSIGHFQMKPSFAEMIHEKARGAMGIKSGRFFKLKSEFEDMNSYRASILADLENPRTELNYLIAFIKICEKKFNLKLKDESERVKFLATAYNYGFSKSAEEIEKMYDKKFFRTTLLRTENYPYSDVSLCWYNQYLAKPSSFNDPGYGISDH